MAVDLAPAIRDALVMARLPRDELQAALVMHNTMVTHDVAPEIGMLVSRGYVATKMGLRHPRRAAQLLDRLVQRGVLRIVQQPAGRRATGYAFNEVARWRGVEWRVEHEEARIVRFDIAAGRLAPTKARFVAPLRAPQDDFRARGDRRQDSACRAPLRAPTDRLDARADARQPSVSHPAHTIPTKETSSLPLQERRGGGSELVLAEIERLTGTPLWGQPEREVRAAVDGRDPAPFIDRVRRLAPGLSWQAHVAVVRDTAVRDELPDTEPVPTPPAWEPPAHELERGAPPPWITAGMTREAWAAQAVVECETVDSGGAN